MASATSIKLDDELKGRVQDLAEARGKARGAEPRHDQGLGGISGNRPARHRRGSR